MKKPGKKAQKRGSIHLAIRWGGNQNIFPAKPARAPLETLFLKLTGQEKAAAESGRK